MMLYRNPLTPGSFFCYADHESLLCGIPPSHPPHVGHNLVRKGKFMRFVSLLAASAVAIGFVGTAIGQEGVIKQRQDLMQKNRHALMTGFGMARGNVPYDAAAAAAAMTIIAEDAAVLPTLFPAGSETGGETKVLPAIWENKADFDAIAAKLGDDAKAAATAAADGLDAFKTALGPVGAACQTCHEKYRASN
jgi:cytochrome c556